MKKIVSLLLLAIMSLSAGTVGGAKSDPRVFGKIFFDYTIQGQTYYEYIPTTSRRFMKLDSNILQAVNKKNFKYSIKGRIEIPSHITGNTVMVNTPTYRLSTPSDRYIHLNNQKIKTKINKVKVRTDSLGNRYIEYKISGDVSKYAFGNFFIPYLEKMTVTLSAKKKRGEDFQWEEAKFYVIEE